MKLSADLAVNGSPTIRGGLTGAEYEELVKAYFGIFPIDRLPRSAEGFDLGCGSGRWAAWVAPRVGRLHCIDPSPEALVEISRAAPTCVFILRHQIQCRFGEQGWSNAAAARRFSD